MVIKAKDKKKGVNMKKSRNSMATHFLVAFSVIIVLPIIILSFFIYKYYIDTLLTNTTDQILQSLNQASKSMEDEFNRLTHLALTVSNDKKIMEFATDVNRSQNNLEKLDSMKELDSRLDLIFNDPYEIESVLFLYQGEGHYFYQKGPMVSEDEVRKMSWYKEAKESAGAINYNIMESFSSLFEKKHVIAFSFRPLDTSGKYDVEVVQISCNINSLSGILSESENTTGNYMVLDQNGQIILDRDKKRIGKTIEEEGYSEEILRSIGKPFTEIINGKKLLITSYELPTKGWLLVNIMDYNKLTRHADQFLFRALIIGGVLVALFLVFTVFSFKQLIVPINELISKMKRVETGDFDQIIAVKGQSEIFYLAKAFNQMVAEIKKLISERDAKEKEKLNAEIEALQSQINPHFLSNTLGSIRLMAIVAKADNVVAMLEAFSKLLSSTYNSTDSIHTVKSEMENLSQYIYIMKYRYGNKFEVLFDIRETIENNMILKMILQPIVENAILHGMAEQEEQGYIIIRGWKENDNLLIEVEDNGMGMNEEQIERLMEGNMKIKKRFTGIGLPNVNKRIKLNYGEEYGLTIESMEFVFTKIKIRLPLVEMPKEGRVDEQCFNR